MSNQTKLDQIKRFFSSKKGYERLLDEDKSTKKKKFSNLKKLFSSKNKYKKLKNAYSDSDIFEPRQSGSGISKRKTKKRKRINRAKTNKRRSHNRKK